MSEQSPSQIEEPDTVLLVKQSSPWVMIITMLLLISGFMLTSVMLLYYAMDGKSEDGQQSAFSLGKLLEKGKTWTAEASAARAEDRNEKEASATDSQESVVSKFFGNKDDGPIRWPKLKLTGFGRSADEEGAFAIINGKHVLVNSYLGDVKLLEIRTHGAVVEYRGEQRLLTVEQPR